MDKLLLINPNIHQEAKLKKDKFLKRIKNVEKIRTDYFERHLLVSEAMEWDFLEELHKAINSGVFNFTAGGHKIFAFEISHDYYDWFRNNSLHTIQKQIINWIAAVYLSRKDIKEYLDDFIYQPVLTEVKKVIQNHYPKDFWEKYEIPEETMEWEYDASSSKIEELTSSDWNAFRDKHYESIHKLIREKIAWYEQASLSYINCLPPKFLKNPLKCSRVVDFDEYGLRYSPKLKIRMAYFTASDWMFIVERNKQKVIESYKYELKIGVMTYAKIDRLMKDSETDTLDRAESDKTIWNNWLFSYRNYEKTNSHIFKLFDEETIVGFIYIVRQRNTSYFKIGWTEQKKGLTDRQSVENRVSSLQTGNPEPLDIVGFFRASGTKTERTLHNYFDTKRRTGEWFLLSDSDWQNILNDNWRIKNNIF